MYLRYYGHSAFWIRGGEGVNLCLDPYRPGGFEGALGYGHIEEEHDVVLVSHDHDDHAAHDALTGGPMVVRAPCLVRGLDVDMLPTWHDDEQGALRGPNNVMIVDIDGLRVVHCGDLGHGLNQEQVDRLGEVDVMMLPVGGHYTLDAKGAMELLRQVQPKLAIPMHFKTAAIGFPLDGPEPFMHLLPGDWRDDDRWEAKDTGEIELTREGLPEGVRVVYLEPTNM